MLSHTQHPDAHVRWETTESDEELQQRIDNETDANTEFNAGLGADLPPRRRIGENTDEELSNSESDPGSMIVAAATSYRRGADLRPRHLSLGGPSGSSPREKANRRIAIYEGNLSPRTAAGPDLGTSPSMESASDDNVSRNNRTNPVDGAKGLGKSKQKRKQLQGSPASASLSDVSPVDLHTHTSAPNPPSQVVGSTLANFGSPYLDPRPLPPVDFPRLFEDTNPVRHDMWDKMDENHPAVVAARKKLDMNPLPDLPSPSWANDPVGGKGKGPAIAPGNKGLIGGPEAPHTNDPNPRRGHAKSMSEGTLPAQKTKAHPPDRVRVQSTATNQRPSRASKPTRGRGKPGERKRGQNEGNRNKSKPGQDPTGPEGRIPPIRIHGPTPAKPDGAPVVDGSPKEGHSPLRSKWGDKIAGWFGRARSDSSASAPELRPSLRARRASHATITSEMPVSEILSHLGKHGCKDITDQLDVSKFSVYPISSGGFGDVYRGSCHNGDRVAIKCLRLRLDRSEIAKKQLKHAARELYVWSRCNHPNVLGLTGMAQYRNQIAMVSPWTKYGNVRQLLSQLPQVDRYALCTQIIDGVAYLHSVGVVHGDLKGDNVLVSEDLTPKLTDFGNAALREYTLQFSDTTSRAGTSLNWVAPEILAEETGLTVEGDVYSLGMEVITGLIPYTGMREFIIMKKIANGEHPVRPEDLPPSTHYGDLLWSLLESCWAYDPKDRPTPDSVRDKANEAHHLRTEKGEINNRKIGSLNALYPVTAVQTSMNNHLSDQPSMRLRF